MAPDLFKPSEHTAALLLHIRRFAGQNRLGSVLEIGTGSGVVIASLLAWGAQRACGVDIETDAVAATNALLHQQGLQDRANIIQGDMWAACGGELFDLVVSNLPHFAASSIEGDGRLSSWSHGGDDGRRVVDRFLRGLPDCLAAGGLVMMTHNVFIDIQKTQAIADSLGLSASVAYTASVLLSPQKLAGMNQRVLNDYLGRGIYRVGEHCFSDFNIVEIRWKSDVLLES